MKAKQISVTNKTRGKDEFQAGRYQSAIGYWKDSMKNIQESSSQVGIHSLQRLFSIVYFKLGDFKKALDFSEKYCKSEGNQHKLSQAYAMNGYIYQKLFDNAKALTNFNNSMEILEHSGCGSIQDLIEIYIQIGLCYRNLQNYLKELESYEKCLSFSTKDHEILSLNSELMIKILIATSYKNQGKLDDCFKYLKESKLIINAHPSLKPYKISLDNCFALYYSALRQFDNEKKKLHSAIKFHEELDKFSYKSSGDIDALHRFLHPSKLSLSILYQNLAISYKNSRNYKESLLNLERAKSLFSTPELLINMGSLKIFLEPSSVFCLFTKALTKLRSNARSVSNSSIIIYNNFSVFYKFKNSPKDYFSNILEAYKLVESYENSTQLVKAKIYLNISSFFGEIGYFEEEKQLRKKAKIIMKNILNELPEEKMPEVSHVKLIANFNKACMLADKGLIDHAKNRFTQVIKKPNAGSFILAKACLWVIGFRENKKLPVEDMEKKVASELKNESRNLYFLENRKGIASFVIREPEKAFNHFKLALEGFGYGFPSIIAVRILINAAIVCTRLENTQKTVELYMKAYEMLKETIFRVKNSGFDRLLNEFGRKNNYEFYFPVEIMNFFLNQSCVLYTQGNNKELEWLAISAQIILQQSFPLRSIYRVYTYLILGNMYENYNADTQIYFYQKALNAYKQNLVSQHQVKGLIYTCMASCFSDRENKVILLNKALNAYKGLLDIYSAEINFILSWIFKDNKKTMEEYFIKAQNLLSVQRNNSQCDLNYFLEVNTRTKPQNLVSPIVIPKLLEECFNIFSIDSRQWQITENLKESSVLLLSPKISHGSKGLKSSIIHYTNKCQHRCIHIIVSDRNKLSRISKALEKFQQQNKCLDYKIQILNIKVDFFSRNLNKEILLHLGPYKLLLSDTKGKLGEYELLTMLFDISNTLLKLKYSSMCYNNFSLEGLAIGVNNRIKLVNIEKGYSICTPDDDPPIAYYDDENYKDFLSPELLNYLKYLNMPNKTQASFMKSNFDPIASDIFSLGLVFLSQIGADTTGLNELEEIHTNHSFQALQDKIEVSIKNVIGYDYLKVIIRDMLEVDPNKRIKIENLTKWFIY